MHIRALKYYKKALEISERLAQVNPVTYEPDVAMIQYNLGGLYGDRNNYPASLNAYKKAVEIYERLAKTNPATYEPSLAATQTNFGNLYRHKKEYVMAMQYYSKALEIFERLTNSNTTPDIELNYCRSILGLGLIQKSNFKVEKQNIVIAYLQKAAQILSKYPTSSKSLTKSVKDLNRYFSKKRKNDPN